MIPQTHELPSHDLTTNHHFVQLKTVNVVAVGPYLTNISNQHMSCGLSLVATQLSIPPKQEWTTE